MTEAFLRRILLGIALFGLAAGLAMRIGIKTQEWMGMGSEEIWTAGAIPVVIVLFISILRNFWIGRFGVDTIVLVSMSAALLLDQSLAAVVVAIMYARGTVLEYMRLVDMFDYRDFRNYRRLVLVGCGWMPAVLLQTTCLRPLRDAGARGIRRRPIRPAPRIEHTSPNGLSLVR